MRRRAGKRGATLSLIVVAALFILVIGMGFFFLTKLLGGARELQNATDSGNLNVAKQSLRTPSLKLFGSTGPYDLSGARLQLAQENFGQLKDTATGELDLLVFNRAVGQSMLVSMNASADNFGAGPPNPLGIANAQKLLDLLANNNDGLGTILAKKLNGDVQMDNSFGNLAQLASVRMLNKPGSSAAAVTASKDVSYMVPSTATNLKLTKEEIPPAFLNNISPNFLANNLVNQAGSTYLKGYSFIDIPQVTDVNNYPLMGVPLRPMTNPHLVSQFDFTNSKKPPLAQATLATSSRIPPNSFKSGGWSLESHQGNSLQALSCAIAGTVGLQGQYTTNIPCGFIVVANGAGFTPTTTAGAVGLDGNAAGLTDKAYGGGGKDIFSDVLMYNTVFVTKNGAMAQNPQAIVDIQNWKKSQAQLGLAQTPVPTAKADALDGPSPKQGYADGIDKDETPVACTNMNSVPGDAGSNKTCTDNLASMAAVYGTNLPGAGGAGNINGLMALEKEKAQVINPRPSGGPAVVTGVNGNCTGLKSFPATGLSPNDPIQFGKVATIGSLLTGFKAYPLASANEQRIYDGMVLKLRQIKPTASLGEIQSVMDAAMPMGAVRYIWMDDSQTFKVTDATNLPSWIQPSNILPDGSTIIADTGDQPVNRTFVNIEGEQNFPSPWDCFGDGSFRNTAQWTFSSGFNCLQGVLRFTNCAKDAGQPWRCPC